MSRAYRVDMVERYAREARCSFEQAAIRLGRIGGRRAQDKRRAEKARREAAQKHYWYQDL